MQLAQPGQLGESLHVRRMNVRADEIQHFNAEIPFGKIGDVAGAVLVAVEHDESTHLQRPNRHIAVGGGGLHRTREHKSNNQHGAREVHKANYINAPPQ